MKHSIRSLKSYCYYTQGDIKTADYLLYVLHGYGQLAEYFLKKFKLGNEKIFIVAPEGMHRFYLKGSSGRVGASWMTKKDREMDINDNLNWLNDLDTEISEQKIFKKKIVLGFSQGGATASRWYYNNQDKFDHLILWASVFPPDLEIDNEVDSNSIQKNYFFVGSTDEYYSESDQNELLEFYRTKNFIAEKYEGNHDVNSEILGSLIKLIVIND